MKKILKKAILPLVLVLIAFTSNAQVNTGANPYLGSEHTYTVNGGVVTGTNTYIWSVIDGGSVLAAGTDYTISGANTPSATITWDKSITTKTYTLRLVEDDGTCQSIREMTVTVAGNALDVSIADLGQSCPDPSVSGVVTTNANPGTTTKTFTVTLATGDASWKPEWTFDYEIANTGSATISSLSVNGVDRTGNLTGDNLTVAAGTLSFDIVVTIDNVLNETQGISVLIDDVIEKDKNTPELATNIGDDNTGLVTISPMPATTDIATDL